MKKLIFILLILVVSGCSLFDRGEKVEDVINEGTMQLTAAANAIDTQIAALTLTPLLTPEHTPTVPLSGKDQPGPEPTIVVTTAPPTTAPTAITAWCENTPELERFSPRWPEDSVGSWSSLIHQEACKWNIQPDAIAAVIHVMSGGNPDYINEKCGTGLMGVMPSDSSCGDYGGLFKDRPTQEDLKNPKVNVEFMAQALAAKVRRLQSYEDAIKFYYGEEVGDAILSAWQKYLP